MSGRSLSRRRSAPVVSIGLDMQTIQIADAAGCTAGRILVGSRTSGRMQGSWPCRHVVLLGAVSTALAPLGRAAGVTGVEQAYRAYREIGRSLTGGEWPGVVPTAVVAGVVQGTMLVRSPS